jgi:hypothetical protein
MAVVGSHLGSDIEKAIVHIEYGKYGIGLMILVKRSMRNFVTQMGL